jgi:hypothetical protein
MRRAPDVLFFCRCPPGRYSALPGASQCTLCPLNTFSDNPGASACTPCSVIGSNLLTMGNGSSKAGDCVCGAGFYAAEEITRLTRQPCRGCDRSTMACDNTTVSTWQRYHPHPLH